MTQRRTQGMVVGKAFGAPIIVQPTTFLMVAIVAYLFASSGSAPTARSLAIGVVLALSLMVSVLLHELAHAAAARAFGRSVSEIVLTLWGGHTSFEAKNLTPLVSATTAVAGPIMNLVIAAVTGIFGAALSDSLAGQMLLSVAWANGLLAAFNLLPGLPMDGGRVVEAVVWGATKNRLRGTWLAAWGGRVVALGVVLTVIAVPLIQGRQPDMWNAMMGLAVAFLLWPAASAALKFASVMIKREALTVRGLMREAVPMPYDTTIADATRALSETVADIVVLGADGTPAGTVAVSSLSDVPEDQRAATSLQAMTVALPRGAVIDASFTAEEIIPPLREWWGRTERWVVLEQGQVVGVVALSDVVAALE